MHLSIMYNGGAACGVALTKLKEDVVRASYAALGLSFGRDAVIKVPCAFTSTTKSGVIVKIRAAELSCGECINPAQGILTKLKRKFKGPDFTVIVECQEGTFEATSVKALSRVS